MSRQWNNHDEMIFEQAIEGAKEARRQMEDKAEAKLWREMTYPVSLADALSQLTKNDLTEIRSNWNIRNASSLNKQDLVDLLSRQIPELLHVFLEKLDETRYAILKRIANAGGQAFVSLEPHEYRYFKLRGLAFTGTVDGNRTLVMPEEILQTFRIQDVPLLHSAVQKHTEWLQLTQGLLYYYGFLPRADHFQMVEQYLGAGVDVHHYLNVMFEGIAYGWAIRSSRDGFMHEEVFDETQVIQEQHSRPNVPFYPFTKAQLLRAGKPGFVDKGPAYKAFADFLRRSYEIDYAEAEEAVDLCVYQIQNGDRLGDIITAVTEEFEIPSMDVLQVLTRLLGDLHNTTRQWALKGHTPRELFEVERASLRPLPSTPFAPKGQVIDIATKKKVGRNEPCPCGSGKKYKKCCGR